MPRKANIANTAMEIAVPTESAFLALADIDYADIMSEGMEGLDITFERIKVPDGGGTMFEMPTEDGETKQIKEFSAAILYHHQMRCYYKGEYTGANVPPDCGSYNGKYGTGIPGGECRNCDLNDYGSGKNGSKACKDKRRLYVLLEGESFPMIISLPTSSIKAFSLYVQHVLTRRKKKLHEVVTRFSLKRVQNKGGIYYALAQFAVDRPLAHDERAQTSRLSEQIKAYCKEINIDNDPYTIADIEATPEDVIDEETGEVIPVLGG
jgi:hypothetical protein